MSSFELGPIRPVSASDRRLATENGEKSALGNLENKRSTHPVEAAVSEDLVPGTPPVDGERVAMIKKAIEEGNYPIVPQKIADAIIANGMLLRTKS